MYVEVKDLEIRCPACAGTMVWRSESGMSSCCHCDSVLKVSMIVKQKVGNVLFSFEVTAYQEVGLIKQSRDSNNVTRLEHAS